MRNVKFILAWMFLSSMMIIGLNAQTTIILQPDPEDGKDAYIESRLNNNNYGDHTDYIATAWTNEGEFVVGRSLIEFDLTVIPSGFSVVSASLSLYNNPTSPNNDGEHSTMDGSNESVLRRIVTSWDEYTVTWNNQPAYTVQNEVILPESIGPHQDYENIDVTAIVQDMNYNPSTSFGFMIRLQTEEKYRCLVFASSDHNDPDLRPKLEITYTDDPPTPDIRCISVDGDSVTISWNPDIDTTLFKYYRIYASYDNGITFQNKISALGDSFVSYSYEDNLASSQSILYYMETQVAQGTTTSPPSDTVRTIFLTLLPPNVRPVANPTWNHLSPELAGLYHILRKDESSDWVQIDSTYGLKHVDTITYPYCDTTLLFYKVEIIDPLIGCISSSTVDNGYFIDGTKPGTEPDGYQRIVQMDSVSVEINGNVAISWEPFIDNDSICEYLIYRNINPNSSGTWDIYDSVPVNIMFYSDTEKLANDEMIAYRITAKDCCNKEGLLGVKEIYYTMYLEELVFDYCDTSLYLQWNAIEYFDPPVSGYEIYEIDTVTSQSRLVDITDDIYYEFVESFQPDSTYCYFVRAINAEGKSSSSCMQCIKIDRPDQPNYLNFLLATVDTATNASIDLTIGVDTSASFTTCIILRKENLEVAYDTIMHIPITDNRNINYSDVTAEVELNDYYYEVIILDECDHKTDLPQNTNRTIFLSGYAIDETTNALTWNAYESTTADIIEYRLIRKINDTVNVVIPLDSTTYSYEDDVSSFWQTGGTFSYIVEGVIHPHLAPPDVDSLSVFSNETAVAHISGIYLPNAFTPNYDGINDMFGPVNYFPDESADYLFLIYNRWGQKIHESTGIEDPGWDGTFEGQPSPTGVYIYYIRYTPPESQQFEERGYVTLLR